MLPFQFLATQMKIVKKKILFAFFILLHATIAIYQYFLLMSDLSLFFPSFSLSLSSSFRLVVYANIFSIIFSLSFFQPVLTCLVTNLFFLPCEKEF
jgi:hypothetical protein